MAFREMTSDQYKIVNRIAARAGFIHRTGTALASFQGRSTTVIFVQGDGTLRFGTAMRNPSDPYNRDIGVAVAFRRALESDPLNGQHVFDALKEML